MENRPLSDPRRNLAPFVLTRRRPLVKIPQNTQSRSETEFYGNKPTVHQLRAARTRRRLVRRPAILLPNVRTDSDTPTTGPTPEPFPCQRPPTQGQRSNHQRQTGSGRWRLDLLRPRNRVHVYSDPDLVRLRPSLSCIVHLGDCRHLPEAHCQRHYTPPGEHHWRSRAFPHCPCNRDCRLDRRIELSRAATASVRPFANQPRPPSAWNRAGPTTSTTPSHPGPHDLTTGRQNRRSFRHEPR